MNSPPPGRLDTGQRFVYATVWTLVHFLLWGTLFYAALFVVPDFMRRFEEFDTNLPTTTIRVIDVSLLVRKYWYLAALLGLIALGLHWFILCSLGKLGRIRVIIIGILFALIPLLLGTMAFLSMQLGWTKLEAGLTMADPWNNLERILDDSEQHAVAVELYDIALAFEPRM